MRCGQGTGRDFEQEKEDQDVQIDPLPAQLQPPQQQQQFVPQQQFAPRQQLQFAPQQQFAPEQPRAPLVPVSQLTREDIALQGFSRDEDQDGQIDPLPAHLQPAQQPQQFQQAAFQPQQFRQQQQFQQPRQQDFYYCFKQNVM